MSITNLNSSSALGQAIKADTALTNERVLTIVHHTDDQQIKEGGKAKLLRVCWAIGLIRSGREGTKRDVEMALSAGFLQNIARYLCKATRRHRPVVSRFARVSALVVRSRSYTMLSGNS